MHIDKDTARTSITFDDPNEAHAIYITFPSGERVEIFTRASMGNIDGEVGVYLGTVHLDNAGLATFRRVRFPNVGMFGEQMVPTTHFDGAII